MADSVQLIGGCEKTIDKSKCIICQSSSSNRTTSTANGRKRIRELAKIRNDDVCKRLKLLGDGDFVYHMNNGCYKGYVLQKRNKLEQKSIEDWESNDESPHTV